jgi:hypothetical protein
VRLVAVYAAAVVIGIGAPFFVLGIARSTSVGADPALAAGAIVVALGIVAALLSALAPRHWLWLALVVSVPLTLFSVVMFAALASVGEFFWIWIWVGVGAVVAALMGALVTARTRRA